MNNTLVAEKGIHRGKYVTTCSPTSQEVISSSESPVEAYNQAKKAGCDDPVLIYIPADNEHTFLF